MPDLNAFNAFQHFSPQDFSVGFNLSRQINDQSSRCCILPEAAGVSAPIPARLPMDFTVDFGRGPYNFLCKL